MELREFVEKSLVEIVRGVEAAQSVIGKGEGDASAIVPFAQRHVGLQHPASPLQRIDFDVAVTVSEQTGTEGGVQGGIAVLGFGARGSSSEQTSSISRLRFTVPVNFRPQDRHQA